MAASANASDTSASEYNAFAGHFGGPDAKLLRVKVRELLQQVHSRGPPLNSSGSNEEQLKR